MKMASVSVIIPVYNTVKYLRRCLESVCGQTLEEIEIICIDDASTDASPAILAEYAARDPRVKVITFDQNCGAAVARNMGIDVATGEYIGFLDADDWMPSDFCLKLFQQGLTSGCDIVKGAYKYEGSGSVNCDLQALIREDKNAFSFEYCSALFKTSLIKNQSDPIRFPNLMDMEGSVFAIRAAIKSNGIALVEDAYLRVFVRSDSMTAICPSLDRLKDKYSGCSILFGLAQRNITSAQVRAFVLAIWFSGFFKNIEECDATRMRFIVDSAFGLFESIEDKDLFVRFLSKQDPFLCSYVVGWDNDKWLFFGKDRRIREQKMLLEERNRSIKFNERIYSRLVCEYVRPTSLRAMEDVSVVSVVNDYAIFDRCVRKNAFIRQYANIRVFDFDNTKSNVTIPRRYNSFIDSYDFNKPGWIVFCHCDWELMQDINKWLEHADPNNVYGAIGVRIEYTGRKAYAATSGYVYERRRDGSGLRLLGDCSLTRPMDTCDCMVFAIHSSLLKSSSFRFDEHLEWDLYIEDSCIFFNKNGHMVLPMRVASCHWSGYHITPPSYFRSLKYMNSKYKGALYAGTISFIGTKPDVVANAQEAECAMFRQRMLARKAAMQG